MTRTGIPIEQARWRRSQIAETFASVRVSAPSYRAREYVGILAVVKSELKLRKVQRQILFAYAVIAAHDSAFEQRPERFNRIGVDDAAHIFAAAVTDYSVRQSKVFATESEQAITGMLIGRN